MENIKIWHTMKEKPKTGLIVCNKNGAAIFVDEFFAWKELCWKEWAYVSDLIATSKALDVAIEALKNIRDTANEIDDPQIATEAIKSISEIMKGGK